MKYTTNYIVYLDDSNSVYCAKCRLTGKFIKRLIAQIEYDLEYCYNKVKQTFVKAKQTLIDTKQVINKAKKGIAKLSINIVLFLVSGVIHILRLPKIFNLLDVIAMKATLTKAEVLEQYNKGGTVVLFTSNQTYLFKKEYTSEKFMNMLLDSGEVVQGRVL